jgi:hypothetical protein
MKYKILIPIALLAGAAIGYFSDMLTTEAKIPCRGGWPYHWYGTWKAGDESGTFRRHILMHRSCLRCGHIQTKASD